MRSPWGQRAAICEHFGWTYDYLLRGIAWVNVQLMLADSARIKDKENKEEQPKKASADDLRAFFANKTK